MEESARADSDGPVRFEEERLRDRVIEHLRRVEHDSISGIARALSEGRPAPIHRLTVAGYLQALAEAGVLKEFERPPSKEYKLQNPEAHWSLAQRVWDLVPQNRNPTDRVKLALGMLQTLLGRPIFESELRQAGIAPLEVLQKQVIPDEIRRAHKRLVEKARTPRIEIPPRDPLYGLAPNDPVLASGVLQDLLRRLTLKATGSEALAADRLPAPAQGRLDLGAEP